MSNYTKIEHGHNAFKDMNYLGSTKNIYRLYRKIGIRHKMISQAATTGMTKMVS